MSGSMDHLEKLLALGSFKEALDLVQAAADQGQSQAFMQLAIWSLAGTVLPRDFRAARGFLRRAVEIGHVDGALMEAALVANGFGETSPSDWAKAQALLREAARQDPVAAAQVALLDAMDLLEDGYPRAMAAPEVLSTSPHVVRHAALLTPAECAHLARSAAELLEPSLVLDPRTGRSVPHPIRSSDHGTFGPAREDLVVRAINLRIVAVSHTPVTHGEPLTVLRYRPGQQYRPHLDTIVGATNQRVRTVLLYLNDAFSGGETHFPQLDLTIRPTGGDAVVFDTTMPDGMPDPRAVHAGLPVGAGAKWLATRWIRAKPLDPWTILPS
jgi:prolyl 4-hydroxylase